MAKSLVIVESPAKAKTINKYLGARFLVKASMGHVRDLPKKTLGVDVEKDFEPDYVPIPDRAKVVAELTKAAAGAEAVYLATDPDREGEAISWHIMEMLGGKPSGKAKRKAASRAKKFHRVMFQEITKSAVQKAFEHPLDVDMNMVYAQQARRILDRLVGYKISPLLWKKVRRGLSAGRVQSVALRMIVDREREIEAFKQEEYWTVHASLEASAGRFFEAMALKHHGKKLKLGTGEETNAALASMRKADWKVETVDSRPRQTAPYPPFITSTLQQEAAKRHGFTVQRTMREAQRLYEGVDVGAEGSVGLITYMRTDSPRMAGDMVHAVRAFVEESYGKNYLPPDPRVYKGKSEAQDAHECIRPTDVRRTPEAMREYLSADAYKLYRLVWERAVASQMASANYDATKAEISAGDYLFRAEGSVLRFEGFMKVYPPVKKTDDVILPPLSEGQALKLLGVEGKQHFTQPPARYTEATLVKTLEGNGIGRPSTYASIIAVIQNRDYVNKTEGKFVPTELGCLVVDMLLKQFEDIMDPTYTARLEEELDKIEEGKMEWREAIGEFYQKFSADLKKADTEMQKPVETTDEVCEKCGSPMVIRWGRFGKFMSCSAYPKCKNAKKLNGASGEGESAARELEEKCPECGKPLVERSGRFGSFVACSGYPACTYKKTPPAAETGVACTRKGCKGKIVERRSRRGKFFYGCTAYPGCDVVFWNRPVPRPCHKCGAAFVLLKTTKKEGSVYLCAQEKCGHKESVPEGDLPQKAAAT